MFLRHLQNLNVTFGAPLTSAQSSSKCVRHICSHTPLLLRKKGKKSTKQRKQKRPASLSSSRQAAAITESVEQAAKELFQSASPALRLAHSTSSCSAPALSKLDIPTPLSSSTKAVKAEKELLRYFGRGRHHYDAVPMPKASAALQCASEAQASRVPFATLFPAPPASVTSPISETAAAASSSSSRSDYQLSKLSPANALPAASFPSVFSRHRTAFAPSNLFTGYDYKLNTIPDWTLSRALNNRFGSVVDSNKFFGATEVPLREIAKEVSEAWATLGAAWEAVVHHAATDPDLSKRIPAAQSVCFVLCYAQTRQNFAVANAMHAVAQEVVSRHSLSHTTAASCIFAVVPVYVGLSAPVSPSPRRDTFSLTHEHVMATCSPAHSFIEYPSGGLYTCAAAAHCLTRMRRRERTVLPSLSKAATDGERQRTYSLDGHVFVVSDAWLNPRNVADVVDGFHPTTDTPRSSTEQDTHCRESTELTPSFSSPHKRRGGGAAREVIAHKSTSPLSFVPEASRRFVHVLPAVITDRLSAKEKSSFGAYLWSTMQRACKA